MRRTVAIAVLAFLGLISDLTYAQEAWRLEATDRVVVRKQNASEQPIRTEAKNGLKAGIVKNRNAILFVEGNDRIRAFKETLRQFQSGEVDLRPGDVTLLSSKGLQAAGKIHRSTESVELTKSLSRLEGARLVGFVPKGGMHRGRWSGAERFLELANGDVVHLEELDLAAGHGFMNLEEGAINATIHGKPAISLRYSGADEQFVDEVQWVSGPKLYKLAVSRVAGDRLIASKDVADGAQNVAVLLGRRLLIQ